MLDPLANAIVNVAFGLLVGAIIAVTSVLEGDKVHRLPRRRPDESQWQRWQRHSRERDDERSRLLAEVPSYRLASAGLYGVVGVIVVVITLTSVDMDWLVFILVLGFGGALIRAWLRRHLKELLDYGRPTTSVPSPPTSPG